MWHDFNKALDDLNAAGFDLSAFKVTGNDMDDFHGQRWVRSNVLRSRVDAVLTYFTIQTGEAPKPRLGFDPPKSNPG